MSFLNFLFLKGSSWAIKLLQGAAPEVSRHLQSPSAWLHTHQSFLACCLCPMYSRGFGQSLSILPGSPWHCRGDSQQEFAPFQGQNMGNEAGTPAPRTNFKSSLCRKNPSAYNTNHSRWFWCSPTLIPRFDLIFNTSFPLSCQAERATLSLGPWSCSPPRWVSPLAAGTAFLPKLLIRSYQNKSQPDRFQSFKLLNWSVCKIIPPIIED